MSVKCIYSCNNCGLPEKKQPDNDRDLIGYAFATDGSIVQRGSREVENHICKQCLRGMQNLAVSSGAFQ
jgi:hypothetical protein